MKPSLARTLRRGALVVAWIFCITVLLASAGWTQSRTYTLDADFDLGILVNVNHDAVHDQLQLNRFAGAFPFICIANSGRGTLVRVDVNTGRVLGEYLSSPAGHGRNPSRTTVDLEGSVWCGNRDEAGGGQGSVVKVGLVIGGTRGNKNPDGSFTPDPNGQYLAPPFQYSTAMDRDGDGLIKTSRGLGDILPWPDSTDGAGGPTALVEDAEDECILIFQRTPGPNTRHVSVDADNNVWVGGYPSGPTRFAKLDGATGAIVTSFAVPCGGYGGLVDGNGVLWSAAINQSQLFRFDIAGGTTTCIDISNSYGLGLDANGYIWNAMWTTNLVAKLSPSGVMEPGFPKPVGGSACRGVAVTLGDNDVWIACSFSNSVSRLDNAGNLRKSIPVGRTPTGVAVDANGKVWVTNFDSNDAMRIDPVGGGDGLGAVDLVVALGAGATPYNYSDMTGLVAFTGTARQGTWTVVYDGGRPAIDWGNVYWTGDEPLGTLVAVEVRAADTEAGLPAVPFVPVMNGVPFYGTGVVGQYVQIRATLSRDPAVDLSPVLFDLTVEANRPPDCSTAVPSVSMLWPPNHKLVPVSVLGVTDPEGSPVAITVTRITQDEPVNSLGDGDTSPDGAGLGTDTAWLRAERTGAVPHNGRVYRVHFTATDALGASCQAAVDVCVPHDKGERASCIDDGQFYDSTSDGRADRSTRFAGGLDVEQRPNPFNPSTSLEYSLGSATRVTVVIYNALGQQVCTLVDGEQSPGRQRAVWDGRDARGTFVPSGVYVYRIRAGQLEAKGKMLLLK